MAMTNKDRIQRMLEELTGGLSQFVEREFRNKYGTKWADQVNYSLRHSLRKTPDGGLEWDSYALLHSMVANWHEVFRDKLGHYGRSWTGELLSTRNDFAHERPFSSDDTLRALDTAQRLLSAISAREHAENVASMQHELRRLVFDEQARSKIRTRNLAGEPKAGLKPWREVVEPHIDVASGKYLQAEFAADLAQVHRGGAAEEYMNPVDFFRRTYLTDGLSSLLSSALLRLTGNGGDPVVELQTNFGGGKTHSMLALYHLATAKKAFALPGVDEMMKSSGISSLPKIRHAVLVGTALSPGNPSEKQHGIKTRSLWGEMAWQLGGKEGYDLVAGSDQNGTSPGSNDLTKLLKRYSPCIILIDEWVAFVRQLYHSPGLPAGSFEANLTFAQALTEAARASPRAVLVASLPASQIEIGGEGGQHALDRLKNTFSRLESSWKPASADEGFEIVRRRLFEPIHDKNSFAHRDAVVREFGQMYQKGSGDFPRACNGGEYRQRMESAYPIHPELFERLYNDWGSLDKFQRTRGVLRLMASVIHALWKSGDKSLMIMPASIPISNIDVQSELVRYLDDGWSAVIGKDVDGNSSEPQRLDNAITTHGKFSAARRVARAIYMGSAPISRSANPGIDGRSIQLGCVQPGEPAGVFQDALRRLADSATYLYQNENRYWFSTQPSVTRLAEERSADYEQNDVDAILVKILRNEKSRDGFSGVHIAPGTSAEIGDEPDARLVILGPQVPYSRSESSALIELCTNHLSMRGDSQRTFQNSLVFLAPDVKRLSELRNETRKWLAWSSIAEEHEQLNLDAFQRRQAESRRTDLKAAVHLQIPETWIWMLVPYLSTPTSQKVEWKAIRLQGQGGLAVRCSKKLTNDELLFPKLGATRLRMQLDEYLWKEKDHISISEISDNFARYLYFPRVVNETVLAEPIRSEYSQMLFENFYFADFFKDKRYVGLRGPGPGPDIIVGSSILVKPEVALYQLGKGPNGKPPPVPTGPTPPPKPAPLPMRMRRYFGSVDIDPNRAVGDMDAIIEEVLQHLINLPKNKTRISVEIDISVPDGVSEEIQRRVKENGTTLGFKRSAFETD